ncbi:hypothetical protein [Amorphus sp. 3PC139-8]|uniref:hypothetical protein n=1 Tax=Amorphus sp. 3PC139-8 TaxID=2735676 RepID=UPI00345DF8D8
MELMMKLMTALTLVLAGAAGMVSVANAEDAPVSSCQALVEAGSCSFAEELRDVDSPVGSLSKVEGRVVISDKEGFTPVRGDKALKVGDRVLLMQDGKALVQAGSFKAELVSPSMVDASRVDGCGCLKVQADTRTFAQLGAGGLFSGVAGGGGVGGGVGGALTAGVVTAGAAGAAAGISAQQTGDVEPGNSPLQFQQGGQGGNNWTTSGSP